MEYRAVVCRLFCVKLDENATKIHGNLQQAFGDNALSRSQALNWHKMFSEGRTLVEEEHHGGRQQYGQVTTQHGLENLFDLIAY
jgi:hypothetical protein